jgi:UDP-N-acetylmuramoyl-tripeptide--D-alanyl-D-alanine ligase
MPSDRVFEANTLSDAARLLREHSRPGDAVLIKGSRGMKMEKILEEF